MKVTNLYHLVLGSGPRPRLQPRDDRTGERHAVTIVPPVSRLECGTSCVPVCWTGAWGYPLAAIDCLRVNRKHLLAGHCSGNELVLCPSWSPTSIFTAAELVFHQHIYCARADFRLPPAVLRRWLVQTTYRSVLVPSRSDSHSQGSPLSPGDNPKRFNPSIIQVVQSQPYHIPVRSHGLPQDPVLNSPRSQSCSFRRSRVARVDCILARICRCACSHSLCLPCLSKAMPGCRRPQENLVHAKFTFRVPRAQFSS